MGIKNGEIIPLQFYHTHDEELIDALSISKEDQKSKNLLTYTSLLIIAINITGASIQEANTFLFKIVFSSPNGITLLLLLINTFFIFRLYQNTRTKIKKLKNHWIKKLLDDKVFFNKFGLTNESNDIISFLPDEESKQLRYFLRSNRKHLSETIYYKNSLLVKPTISLHISRGENAAPYSYKFNLSSLLPTKLFLKLLISELKHKTISILTFPQYLELWFPFYLYIISLLSTYFKGDLLKIISEINLYLELT